MTSIKRNYFYNIAYQVLAIVMPLVTSPYLSRVLGASQLGVYSYTFSIANYFVLFAMLGVNNYGNRCVARARDDRVNLSKEFWSVYSFQAFLSIIVSVIYIGFSLYVANDTLIALIWLPYVLSAGLDINWLFFGLEEFRTTVTRNFIVKLFTFVLMFLVVRGEHALASYCLLMSVSYLVSVLVLWPFVRRHVDYYRPSFQEVFSHLGPNLTLFVPVIAVSLYTVLDKVMLGLMNSMEQTGYFDNALKVAQMPFTLITALGTVMLPRAANLMARGDAEGARKYLGISMWLALILSSAFAFGLSGVAEVFAPVFFGPGFEACAPVICVIVLEMPFMAWANVLRTQYLIPAGRDRAYVLSVFVGAAVNVVVNLSLIPRMGALGAAWGTAAAEAAVCLVQALSVRGELPQRGWLFENIPFYVIGLIMFVAVRLMGAALGMSFSTLVLQVIAGAALFTTLSFIWCCLTRNRYFMRVVDPVLERLHPKWRQG